MVTTAVGLPTRGDIYGENGYLVTHRLQIAYWRCFADYWELQRKKNGAYITKQLHPDHISSSRLQQQFRAKTQSRFDASEK